MIKTLAYRIGCIATLIGTILLFCGWDMSWLIGIPALALVLYGYDH